jgi:hypothetical protein
MRKLLIAVSGLAGLLALGIVTPGSGGADQNRQPASGRTPVEARRPFFSIVFTSDVHISSIPAADAAWDKTANWLTANKAAWNIQGLLVGGDIVQDPANVDGVWQTFISGLNTIQGAGIPYIITPGNHDTQFYSHAQWDKWIAPLNAAQATFTADSNNVGSTEHAHNVVNYLRVDAPTMLGTFKMALVGEQWVASPLDIAQARTWMDGDTDRQFIVGTHFITVGYYGTVSDARLPPWNVHLCQYNECVAPNSFGIQDGVDMWNGLKDNPRIVAVMSGHWHYIVSLPLTLSNGAAIPSFANYNEANPTGTDAKSVITILKFRPADKKMDIISWDAIHDAPDTRWNGTGTASYDWEPIQLPRERGGIGRGR